MMFAKTLAFAKSFSDTISHSMKRLILGSTEFKAIMSKEYIPDIVDTPAARATFKAYVEKTFTKYPDTIQTF
jgi:hypothetical protein